MGCVIQEIETSKTATCRVFTVHILYIVYTILITTKLFLSLTEAGKDDAGSIGGWSFLTFVCVVSQFGALKLAWKRICWEYVNISLLVFVIFTMVQYGFGLYYSHLNIAAKEDYVEIGCVNLKTDMFGYVVYLTTLPMMIITNLLYPYPIEDKEWQTALISAFSMLDFLDMAELIFSDIGCYLEYEYGYLVLFCIATGISAILTAFTNGLEQTNKDLDEKTSFDFLVTLFNLIFNDLLFLILRIIVMAKEGHVYFGLIFVIKEFCSLLFRASMLIHYWKH